MRVISLGAGLWMGCTCAVHEGPALPADAPVDAPPTVVLVVLDTVRADHVDGCGAPWGITPTWRALAARPDAVVACDGWSPGTWTHPSHASLFTGWPVDTHGALWAAEGGVSLNPVTRVRPLDPGADTLAEQFGRAGYVTAAVSANPILVPGGGLLQGFDKVHVAGGMGAFRGDALARPLLRVLGEIDRDRPLFLFVNVYDAHDPFPAVPDGAPWGAPGPRVDLHPHREGDTAYGRFLRGDMPEAEARDYLATVRAAYAQGVHEADRGLGLVLEVLDRFRDLDAGLRLVVTSDHGELLGEHRLLRHGGFLWEPAIRVPTLWVERGGTPAPLPEPFATRALFDVIRRGTVPAWPVTAVSEPNPDDARVGVLGAAVRHGDRKHVCIDGTATAYDLAADPAEATPLPVSQDADLAALCARAVDAYRQPAPEPADAVQGALRAVGYVE